MNRAMRYVKKTFVISASSKRSAYDSIFSHAAAKVKSKTFTLVNEYETLIE